jgi:hypothetical protein
MRSPRFFQISHIEMHRTLLIRFPSRRRPGAWSVVAPAFSILAHEGHGMEMLMWAFNVPTADTCAEVAKPEWWNDEGLKALSARVVSWW